MLHRIIAAASLTLALLFSGCATERGMAVLDNPTSIAKSNKPIYLMTVTMRNTYVTAYQPKLVALKVQKITKSDYPTILLFEADQAAKSESISPTIGNSYLLRMELEPGEYTILGINSMGQSMLLTGTYFVPIDDRVVSSNSGIHYLGHVEATLRKRNGDEFHAGGLFPIQDQNTVGAFSGTFDVEISDRWETDSANFLAKFPALSGANVKKDIMSPFNRARVQQWWEKNAFNEVP
jgi:hypothetical protein